MPQPRISTRSIGVLAALVVAACGDSATEPTPASAVGQLSVGEMTACALSTGASLYCWGQNSIFYEYGTDPGTLPTSAGPVLVSAPPLAALMPGVSQHMCGQAATSALMYCWGRGGVGQLGTGMTEPVGNTYSAMAGSWNVVSVSRLSGCGVTAAGTGMCWGTNQRGEIGTTAININGGSPLPVPVDVSTKFKMIAAGWLHACGITTEDRAMCWGDNRHGQLGIGTIDASDAPADQHRTPDYVATTEKFLMLSSGALQTCGITTSHHAVCWGDNETGQLGDGTKTDRSIPTTVASDQSFSMITIGSGFRGGAAAPQPTGASVGASAHTCALTTAGNAYCWGWNGDGQLGDGTTADRTSPGAVKGAPALSTIGAGGAFTCGMRGQQVWCWGANGVGQLGNAHFGVSSTTPVTAQVPFSNP